MLMRDLRVGGRVSRDRGVHHRTRRYRRGMGHERLAQQPWRTVKAINSDDHNIKKKDAQYGDENFLIVGTDTRAGKNSSSAPVMTPDRGCPPDTIILVNILANRSRVVAVSFPATNVSHPECEGFNDQTGEYTGEWVPAEDNVKLNSVYAIGGGSAWSKTITMISGLNINHFIGGMDFVAFRKIVDTVGGVGSAPHPALRLRDRHGPVQGRSPEAQRPQSALKYVRARTISTEGNGDYGRIKRQQLFASSLLRSTLSGNVISNPAKLNRRARTFTSNSYVDNVDTESLLNLADSMRGIEAGRVTIFITIPTSGERGRAEQRAAPRRRHQALFSAIINDDPLPGEEPEKSSEKKVRRQEGRPGAGCGRHRPR